MKTYYLSVLRPLRAGGHLVQSAVEITGPLSGLADVLGQLDQLSDDYTVARKY